MNPIYAEEATRISGQMTVPVVEIGSKVIIGFSKTKILEALK